MKNAPRSPSLSRREALGRLGLGAGLGAIAAVKGAAAVNAAFFQSAIARTKMAPIPKGAIVRTILKDLPPDGLGNGAILFHEHLSLHGSFFQRMRPANAPALAAAPGPFFMENVDVVIDEVRASAKDGVTCIVDGGHPDMTTQYANLKKIAHASGVHIVASGGYYLQTMYPPEVANQSEEQLVDGLVRDAAAERWGAFGEIGSSLEMTADERKVFRTIGKAQIRTGLPVFTHTSHAGCKKCALEQLDILESVGANPGSLCIGHLSDISDDPQAQTHKEIARRGAFLGFDTVGHQLGPGDGKKVALIMAVLEAGYEDHVLLSSDFASERETKFNAGAGYSTVTGVFLPKLRYAGVKEATIHKMINENPKRFLAWVPKKAT